MNFFPVLKGLHLRYDGPIPKRQRNIAHHGSLRASRRHRARAMADRYSIEYGRILGELWRHEFENAHGMNIPIQDRLRDLRFYRRQRVEWDRHASVLLAATDAQRPQG